MSGTWKNNGHSVEFTPHNSTNAVMTTSVGQYKLLSFHMHWDQRRLFQSRGSEHLIDSEASDLEVHFVHVKQHVQDKTASDYYAVLSVRGNSQTAVSRPIFSQLSVK